jgi:hypothetical protein
MLRPVLAVSALLAPVALAFAAPPVLANPTPLPMPTVTTTVKLPQVPPRLELPRFVQATFDDVPVGIVDTAYQTRGITFACNGCSTAHTYAALSNPLITTPGQNQVVSPFAGNIFPYFDDRSGVIQALFTQSCTSVSVLAAVVVGPEGFGTPTNRPYLKAFGANGQQVGATIYGTPPGASDGGAPAWQQLTANTTSAAPITSMRFGVEHASGRSVQGMFDNVVCQY